MSETHAYETRIAALLATYVLHKEADAMERLLAAMGCETMAWSQRDDFNVVTAESPDSRHEPFIRRTLVLVIRLYLDSQVFEDESNMSLISGLAKNNRWVEILQSRDAALDLALLLLMLADSLVCVPELNSDAYGKAFIPAATRSACTVLNGWLQSDPEIVAVPSGADLARMLFSDVWCAVEPALHMHTSDIYEAVVLCRPPFIQGLLPAHLETPTSALPLPSLGPA